MTFGTVGGRRCAGIIRLHGAREGATNVRGFTVGAPYPYDIGRMSFPRSTELMPSPARGILVVDDHDLVRLGLRAMLMSHAGSAGLPLEVLEARSLQHALEVYRTRRDEIALVLLDLNLPDASGIDGLRRFRTEFPDARVAVLSGATDPVLVQRALDLGVSAFLAKSADLQRVVDHLRGEGLLDVATEVASDAGPGEAGAEVCTAGGQRVKLTPRQAEVLRGILAGRSNREIAEQMRLSEGTVKNHVSALLLTFGARSRAQLISQLR